MKTPKIGSISKGTFLNSDLIPEFLDAVREYAPDHYIGLMAAPFGPIPAYVMDEGADSSWWTSLEAMELRVQLEDILNECAPEGAYFGAHHGNDSDFGFWLYE